MGAKKYLVHRLKLGILMDPLTVKLTNPIFPLKKDEQILLSVLLIYLALKLCGIIDCHDPDLIISKIYKV